MTFPETEAGTSPAATTRIKRTLAEQAIASAAAGKWSEAADTNRRLIELGADQVRDRGLAGTGETREPEGEAAPTRLPGLRVLVAVDVFRHAFLSSPR